MYKRRDPGSQIEIPALSHGGKRFWKGQELEAASRLIFYFGGHGASEAKDGLLITYNHDRTKPTSTSFLMSDFLTRHFRLAQVHHFLVLLDSCSSGLAIGAGFLSNEASESDLRRFATLTTIRADTEQPARNILVAGTGEQRALAETGGIFTKAIISGLRGDADYNGDGVIQFAELALYVSNKVSVEASMKGIRQDPHSYFGDLYGTGKVLFLRRPSR